MNKWIAEFELEDGDTMPEHMDLEYKGARIDFHCKPLKQESTTKNDLGVDCISRAQTQAEIENHASRYTVAKERGGMGQVEWSDQLIKVSDAVDIIRNLPSVTPQETRKGEWCPQNDDYFDWYECSECGYGSEGEMLYSSEYDVRTNYCPNCGAKMVDPQESEG